MSNNSNLSKEKVDQQADKNVIKTKVFTELYVNDKDTNDQAKVGKLYNNEKNRCLYFGDITQKEGFKHSLIGIVDYKTFRRKSDNDDSAKREIIYRIEKTIDDKYTIVAGKYCGFLSIPVEGNRGKSVQLEISCGYSDRFFKRILDFCCGIYVNDNPFGGEKATESIYSLLVQYMFLVSLRKTINNGLPKKYVVNRERGYGVKGNVDIESYINSDLQSFDKKLTSVFSERKEIQSIADVLYFALTCCKVSNGVLPNLVVYRNYLHGLYSGVKPSRNTIRKALSELILKNSMYSSFRLPLKYAEILINHNNITSGNSAQSSGFLVDASFLWEMYLYNLLRLHFPEWSIDSQAQISVYGGEDVFYEKNNYPDIVMTKGDKIIILDAKFKRMTFSRDDVDMGDFRQIHFYAYYYSVKNPDKQIYSALVYPTKGHCDGETSKSCRFGGEYGKGTRFNVLTIEDPGDKDLNEKDLMLNSERKFIANLRDFIGL